jgi:hypothetical protein
MEETYLEPMAEVPFDDQTQVQTEATDKAFTKPLTTTLPGYTEPKPEEEQPAVKEAGAYLDSYNKIVKLLGPNTKLAEIDSPELLTNDMLSQAQSEYENNRVQAANESLKMYRKKYPSLSNVEDFTSIDDINTRSEKINNDIATISSKNTVSKWNKMASEYNNLYGVSVPTIKSISELKSAQDKTAKVLKKYNESVKIATQTYGTVEKIPGGTKWIDWAKEVSKQTGIEIPRIENASQLNSAIKTFGDQLAAYKKANPEAPEIKIPSPTSYRGDIQAPNLKTEPSVVMGAQRQKGAFERDQKISELLSYKPSADTGLGNILTADDVANIKSIAPDATHQKEASYYDYFTYNTQMSRSRMLNAEYSDLQKKYNEGKATPEDAARMKSLPLEIKDIEKKYDKDDIEKHYAQKSEYFLSRSNDIQKKASALMPEYTALKDKYDAGQATPQEVSKLKSLSTYIQKSNEASKLLYEEGVENSMNFNEYLPHKGSFGGGATRAMSDFFHTINKGAISLTGSLVNNLLIGEEDINNRLKKFREEMDREHEKALNALGTSKEYVESGKYSDIYGIETILPYMVMGELTVPVMAVQGFASTQESLEDNKNLSQGEKDLVSALTGITTGMIMHYLPKAVKGETLVNSLVYNAINSGAAKGGLKEASSYIEKQIFNIASNITSSAVSFPAIMTASGLSEKGITDITNLVKGGFTIKESDGLYTVYNKDGVIVHQTDNEADAEYYANAIPTRSWRKDFGGVVTDLTANKMKDVRLGAYMGLIGGVTKNIQKANFDRQTFADAYNLASRKETFITMQSQIRQDLADKKITAEEAKDRMKKLLEFKATISKIPDFSSGAFGNTVRKVTENRYYFLSKIDNVNERLKSGQITEEKAEQEISNIEREQDTYRQALNNNIEKSFKAWKIITENQNLEAEKAGYHESLRGPIQKRIDANNEALKEIAMTEDQAYQHEKEGGSTFQNGLNVTGKKLSSVSIFPERTELVEGRLTQEQIDKYVEKNKDLLEGNEDVLAVGTWKTKEGVTYLDISSVVPHAEAEELGRKYNQKAVFNLEKMKETETGGTGEAVEGLKPEAERVRDIRDIAGKTKASMADFKPMEIGEIEQSHPELASAARNALQAMSLRFPDIKVRFHDTNESMQIALKEGNAKPDASRTKGNFAYTPRPGGGYDITIDFNLKTGASEETIRHEFGHAALLSEFGEDPGLFAKMKSAIRNFGITYGDKALVKFSNMYDKADRAEEYLAELAAIRSDITPGTLSKIAEYIGDLVSKATDGKLELFKNVRNTNEAVRYFGSLAEAVRTGKPVEIREQKTAEEKKTTTETEQPKDRIKSKQALGGKFSAELMKEEDLEELKNEGYLRNGISILDLDGETVIAMWPDNKMVGDLYFGEEENKRKVLEGNGGIRFSAKFNKDGTFWASSDRGSAALVKVINELFDKNGGRPVKVVVFKGTDTKVLSSRDGMAAAMDIMSAIAENGDVPLSLFKKALSSATENELLPNGKKRFPANQSSAEMHKQIKDFFLTADDETFKKRAEIAKKIIASISKDKSFNHEKVATDLGMSLGKSGKIVVADLIERLGNVQEEGFLENVKKGRPYAYIEIPSKLKIERDKKHISYPATMKTVDGKRVTISMLEDNSLNLSDIQTLSGKPLSELESKEARGAIGNAQRGFNVIKIEAKSKQQLITEKKMLKQMTEDEDGNFLFYHYSPSKITGGIDPRFFGRNPRTGRDERPGIGISMYYTRPDYRDVGGNYGYVVRVPKDKVYPFNADPLNLYDKAEAAFQKMYPGQAFDANKQVAFIAQEASKLGYKMTVAKWGDNLRAQTTDKLKPEWYEKPHPEYRNSPVYNPKLEDYKANENKPKSKQQIDAYHGTPHDFDKFSTQYMGTGEGAQAFGWGMYFTDVKDIAKKYAEKLSKETWSYDNKNISSETLEYLFTADEPWLDIEWSEDRIKELSKIAIDKIKKIYIPDYKDIAKTSWSEKQRKEMPAKIKEANNSIKELKDIINSKNISKKVDKNLYDVTLHKGKTPDQYTYLEWDKKPDKQQVGKLLSKLTQDQLDKGFYYGLSPDATNQNLYKGLSRALGGDKAASLFLLENGIDGIKYPAESISRGTTSETARGFNYVVFDENAVTVNAKSKQRLSENPLLAEKDYDLSKDNIYDALFDIEQGLGIRINNSGYSRIDDTLIRIKNHTPDWSNFNSDLENDNSINKVVNVTVGDYENSDSRREKTTLDQIKKEYPNVNFVDIKVSNGESINDSIKKIHDELKKSEPKSKQKLQPGDKTNIQGIDVTIPDKKEQDVLRAERTEKKYFDKEVESMKPSSLSKEELKAILDRDDIAILTGTNPDGNPIDDNTNKLLNEKAEEWLQENNYKYYKVTGKYDQTESSFLVEGMTGAKALEFAKEFKQDSVAHSEGLIYSNDTIQKRDVKDDAFDIDVTGPGANYVSAIKTKDGNVLGFKIGIDFNERVEYEPKSKQQLTEAVNSDEGYDILDSDKELKGSTWAAGGCYPLARAIKKAFGGDIVAIYDDKGVMQHVMTKLSKDVYADSDGIGSEREKLRTQKEDEGVSNPKLGDFDESKLGKIPIGSEETVDKIKDLILKSEPKSKQQLTEKEIRDNMDRMFDEYSKKMKGRPVAEVVDRVIRDIQHQWFPEENQIEFESAVRSFKKDKGIKVVSPPSQEKISGQKPKEVTVKETTALKDQIRLEARAARDGEKSIKNFMRFVADGVKSMVGRGVISANQSAAISRRMAWLNPKNGESIEKFYKWVDKIFTDADYADRLSEGNNLRKKIKKNAASGNIPDMLKGVAARFARISPDEVSDINEYNDIAAKLQEATKPGTVTIKKDGTVADNMKVSTKISEIDRYIESQMDAIEKEKEKSEPKDDTEAVSFLKDKIEDMKSSVNELIETGKSPVDGEEVKLSSKEKAMVKEMMDIDTDDKQKLKRVAEAMDHLLVNGDMGKIPNIVLQNRVDVKAEKGVKILEKATRGNIKRLKVEGLISRVRGAIWKPLMPKNRKSYARDWEYLLNNSVRQIDLLLKQLDGMPVFNSTFRDLASGYANYKSKLGNMDASKAWKKMISAYHGDVKKAVQSNYKITMYLRQLEHESNPGINNALPAIEYYDKIIESRNNGLNNTSKEEFKSVMKDFIKKDADGNRYVDKDALYNSMNKAEKEAISAIQNLYKQLTPYAKEVAHIRGTFFDPIANYSHINANDVGSPDYDVMASEMDAFMNGNVSTRAGQLESRTGKAVSISLDPFATANKAIRDVMLDYYMTNPIKVLRKITEGFKESTAEGTDEDAFAKAFQDISKALVKKVVQRSYSESSIVDKAIEIAQKRHIEYQLANPAKAAAEVVSNMGYISTRLTKEFGVGAQKYSKFILGADGSKILENVNSYSTDRLYPHGFSGKFIDPSTHDLSVSDTQNIPSELERARNVAHYNTLLWLQKRSKAISETMLTSPDVSLAIPTWFGSMALKFKEITGKEIDFDKISANDFDYMEENRKAIEQARDTADKDIADAFSTKNPFLVSPRLSNVEERSRVIHMMNNYLSNFSRGEFEVVREAIVQAAHDGHMSKADAARTLAAATVRAGTYKAMRGMAAAGLTALGAFVYSMTHNQDDDDELTSKLRLAKNDQEIAKMELDYFVNKNPKIPGVDPTIMTNNYMTTSDKFAMEKMKRQAQPANTFAQDFTKGVIQSGVQFLLNRNFGSLQNNMLTAPLFEEYFNKPMQGKDYDRYRDAILYDELPSASNEYEAFGRLIEKSAGPIGTPAVWAIGKLTAARKRSEDLKKVNQEISDIESGEPTAKWTYSKYEDLLNRRRDLEKSVSKDEAIREATMAVLTATSTVPFMKNIKQVVDRATTDNVIKTADWDELIKNYNTLKKSTPGSSLYKKSNEERVSQKYIMEKNKFKKTESGWSGE